jgi:hypothetical protein
MRKLRASAAVAAIVGGVLIAGATPAQAEVVRADCETGVSGTGATLTFHGFAEYAVQGATQHWDYAEWTFGGFGVGNKSNTNIRLRHSPDGISHSTGHRTYFSYDSRDGLHPDTPYSTVINTNVPTSENIYLKFDTIFDLPLAPDVNCAAYTPFA